MVPTSTVKAAAAAVADAGAVAASAANGPPVQPTRR
jgi:hypothetical protein